MYWGGGGGSSRIGYNIPEENENTTQYVNRVRGFGF